MLKDSRVIPCMTPTMSNDAPAPAPPGPPHNAVPRRRFVKAAAAAGVAGAVAFPHVSRAQDAVGKRILKVGLVGCGGRGTGAANQALSADPNVRLWAVGDVFESQVAKAIGNLAPRFGAKVEVGKSRRFVGLDAYRKVIDSGVDVVLLTSPPGFRPQHFAAAVMAGKHVFAEKPMAVDMAGVKSVLASARLAKTKGICIQHGFCWRFAPAVREAYARVLAGEIGAVRSVYGTYLANVPKPMTAAADRKPGWSDVEWQVRNWMGYEWLSGGPFLEQAIHTVDKVAWAMGDVPPLAAVATGGRVQRDDDGNVYDHYNVAYEYPGGVIAHVGQRQLQGAYTEVIDRVAGEKGRMIGPGRPMIYDAGGKAVWRHRGRGENMYQVCHNELFAAIRKGEALNTGDYMANSTALGLLGREAAHTGRRITWDMLMASAGDLAPDSLKWTDAHKVPGVPVPGT